MINQKEGTELDDLQNPFQLNLDLFLFYNSHCLDHWSNIEQFCCFIYFSLNVFKTDILASLLLILFIKTK